MIDLLALTDHAPFPYLALTCGTCFSCESHHMPTRSQRQLSVKRWWSSGRLSLVSFERKRQRGEMEVVGGEREGIREGKWW